MTRGFAAVALERPKDMVNVGSAIRALQAFAADLLIVDVARWSPQLCKKLTRTPTDTMQWWRHMPVIPVRTDIMDLCPLGATPVAVEIVEGAAALPSFKHPERAFYVFGPEDGSVRADTLRRCHRKVYIPTTRCLNLAAAVNVVLYDRSLGRA